MDFTVLSDDSTPKREHSLCNSCVFCVFSCLEVVLSMLGGSSLLSMLQRLTVFLCFEAVLGISAMTDHLGCI